MQVLHIQDLLVYWCLYIISLIFKTPDFSKITDKEKENCFISGINAWTWAISPYFEKIKSHEEYSADIIKNPNGNIAKY
nr:hypothetical protein [Entomoplasma sp. MP1]